MIEGSIKEGGAPTFFNVYFQVANEVGESGWPIDARDCSRVPSLHFKTKQNWIVSGWTHSESAFDFTCDESLQGQTVCLKKGTASGNADNLHCFQEIWPVWANLSCAKSKTGAIFSLHPSRARCEDADTGPILINTAEDTGEIPFSVTFKLLESEIELRI
jgi:hypothetical protein